MDCRDQVFLENQGETRIGLKNMFFFNDQKRSSGRLKRLSQEKCSHFMRGMKGKMRS